jgi:hypothetical protein
MAETHRGKRLVGYARISTYGQTFESQIKQLRAAGCSSRNIYREIVHKNPPNPNYISMSLWGFFSFQRSAAFFVGHRPGKSRASSLGATGSASHSLCFRQPRESLPRLRLPQPHPGRAKRKGRAETRPFE